MTEKILTIAIPCYNSQDYVRRALDSVVPAGERLEVLVVDDGSTDGTAAIATEKKGSNGVRAFSFVRDLDGVFFRSSAAFDL